MKIIRGLQSENQLGGWYRIFGDTSLRHECQIAFQNSKVLKLFNFLAFVLISNQRSVAYFVSQCAIQGYSMKTFGVKIANNWSLWLPANKHFSEKRFCE